jgi:hypothetical protein
MENGIGEFDLSEKSQSPGRRRLRALVRNPLAMLGVFVILAWVVSPSFPRRWRRPIHFPSGLATAFSRHRRSTGLAR